MNTKKHNKIDILDYNFHEDILVRKLLTSLNSDEMHILREIIDNSLKINFNEFSGELGYTKEFVSNTLQKFIEPNLLKLHNNEIVVDKKVRKQFESVIEKFKIGYEPGLEYIQLILSKLPIDILPVLYNIPKSSNNIFESILEKYLLSPKIFEKYLLSIQNEETLLNSVIQEMLESPGLEVSSEFIISKYQLSDQELQKNIIIWEFLFVVCETYKETCTGWKSYISFFKEWKEYLQFIRKGNEFPLIDQNKVDVVYNQDFGFVRDISTILEEIKNKPLPLSRKLDAHSCRIVQKICQINLGHISKDKLYPLELSEYWLSLSIEDRAMFLYRQSISSHLLSTSTESDVHEIKRSLKRIKHVGWVIFSDFMRGFTAPIHKVEPVTLRRKGKAWQYTLPEYSECDVSFIEETIYGLLFEAGIVSLGTYEGISTFKLTPFGQRAIGN